VPEIIQGETPGGLPSPVELENHQMTFIVLVQYQTKLKKKKKEKKITLIKININLWVKRTSIILLLSVKI
jgi:hypothetical protein